MKIISILYCFCVISVSFAQTFPGEGDNIDYLVTSGKNADLTVGDDDHQQSIFFLLPKNADAPFYIRIYDPETSGSFDEMEDSTETTTEFSVYGGKGCHSSESRSVKYQKNISGTLLKDKSFGSSETYDGSWYSFGPFSPKKGEYSSDFDGYIFKLVVEGKSGTNANLYKIALSSDRNKNVNVPGANIFTYEYSFRLKSKTGSVAHVYPFMDKGIVSIKQYNFDSDSDIDLQIFSVVKKGESGEVSGNGNWSTSKHLVAEDEKGKCLDIQLQKRASWHNDIVMYVLNQYDEAVPFFASPIGGSVKPKFTFESEK